MHLAELLLDGLGRGVEGGAVSHVQHEGGDVGAFGGQSCAGRLERIASHVGQRQTHATRGQHTGEAEADAAGGTADEGDAALPLGGRHGRIRRGAHVGGSLTRTVR